MEQSTQYLYEYQNGERVRSLGFAKIENERDSCHIRVYGKQMDEVKGILFQNEKGETYVGRWEPEKLPVEEKVIAPSSPEIYTQEEVETYIVPMNVKYEKIQRQDLSRLPRKEWRIANNTFLLHGFYNYHHLLYIEDDGEIWIGVPGIYHEREKVAAEAFGFTAFRRLTDVEVELAEDEKNTYEDFGYWCRQISISSV